jgi:hypothetical protein
MLPAVWQLGAREQQPRTVSQHLIHLRFALHGCNIVTFKVSVSRSQNRTLRASQPRATITRTASAPSRRYRIQRERSRRDLHIRLVREADCFVNPFQFTRAANRTLKRASTEPEILSGCAVTVRLFVLPRFCFRPFRCEAASAPVPIRPLVGFGNPTLESRIREQPGNNKSSLPFLDVLLCSFMPP